MKRGEKTLNWCDLTLEEKIIVVLGAYGKPMRLELLEYILFLLDKAHECREEGGD